MWKISSPEPMDISLQDEVSEAFEALLKREDLGFFQMDLMKKSITDTKGASPFLKNKKGLVVIGLGGSSLGTKAISAALCPGQTRLHFLDNVDGQSLDQFLEALDEPESWGWVLCSKSGGTIEVTTLFDYCYLWLKEKHNISILENTLVVTEEKPSLLFDLAKKEKLPLLPMPKNIGGRFSVFTSVGLFPLSFLELNLNKFYAGFEACLNEKKLVIELATRLMTSVQKQDQSLYFFQYSDQLTQWSLWLQQLLSESLGKKQTRDSGQAPNFPTVVPCRGASDQHSVLQQIIEGPQKNFCCFHRVESSEVSMKTIKESLFGESLLIGKSPGELLGVEAEATQKAMTESQIPTMVLKTQKLDEESLGYLMAAWMLSTGVLGEMMNINAFDQPGVESGKSIARRVLSQVN